jgi:hypothetical protein
MYVLSEKAKGLKSRCTFACLVSAHQSQTSYYKAVLLQQFCLKGYLRFASMSLTLPFPHGYGM